MSSYHVISEVTRSGIVIGRRFRKNGGHIWHWVHKGVALCGANIERRASGRARWTCRETPFFRHCEACDKKAGITR